MAVPCLLLEILDDLVNDDLKTLQWHLTMEVLDGCKPIPKSQLENASRTATVSKMIQSYGEKSAVDVTVQVLKKMGHNNAAENLKQAYTAIEGKAAKPSASASSSAPAAPAAISAQSGSVIFAPTLSGSTSGAWNVTINK